MKKRCEIPRWVGFCVMGLGLAFLIAGICRGEMDTVFKKAVNICLECIGIG